MATPRTEADIDAIMARAVEAAVRRHPSAPPPAELPNDLASTLASLTDDGWCQVGRLAAGAARRCALRTQQADGAPAILVASYAVIDEQR